MKKFVWDNANIVESYPGVCLPLTFSFARYIYEQVYLQTGIFFGVDEKNIKQNSRMLETFLGYFNGHFYYNLETWCDLIAYLPGFGQNPKMLQEMMGVKVKDRLEIKSRKASNFAKIKLIFKLLYFHYAINRLTKKWTRRFDSLFKEKLNLIDKINDPYKAMDFYFNLEIDFLNNWQIPILNDFLVMIYSGLLKRYYSKILKKQFSAETLADIGGKGNVGIVLELQKLANNINSHPSFKDIFLEKDNRQIWESLKQSEFGPRLQNFLDTFGLRNGHDLKLENPSLRENPEIFVTLLKQYINQGHLKKIQDLSLDLSNIGLIGRYLIEKTRQAISRREQMRVKRSQVFGIVRQAFVIIGRDFAKQQILDDEKDIFYLEMEEIFSYLRGTATLLSLKELVNLRKEEFRDNEKQNLKNHFITTKLPYLNEDIFSTDDSGSSIDNNAICGTPNYHGNLTGEVIVLDKPDLSQNVKGKILVCPQTDPSWTPIFGLIGGLIVERGGILSHAAIVARELRIPSMVGVQDITKKLQTGDKILLDTYQGLIKKI